MASRAKAYERQKGEATLWYKRFKDYYLPLEGEVNVQKAWEAYIDGERAGKRRGKKSPDQAWYKAAKRDNWEKRKLAFDRDVYAGVLREMVKDVQGNVVNRVKMGLRLQEKIKQQIELAIVSDEVSLNELTLAFKRLGEATAPDFEKFVELYADEAEVDQGVERLDVDALDHVIDSYAALFEPSAGVESAAVEPQGKAANGKKKGKRGK